MDKVVALDLGNVCVKIDPAGCLRAIGAPSMDAVPAEFLAVCADFETGRVDEAAWLDAFRLATEGKFPPDRLRDAFCRIIGDEMPGMAAFVRELTAAGRRVALLSDTSPLHLYYSLSKLSFAHLLTGGAYSFEAGARKPDTAMFKLFEARYGKPCFYADDKPENVAAAAALGWTAHVFTTADDCREAFAKAMADARP